MAAFRAALREQTRERVPLDWATTQSNLGSALASLGEREGRADLPTVALAAARDAHAVLKEAGMSHYDGCFAMRIETFEAALATMRAG